MNVKYRYNNRGGNRSLKSRALAVILASLLLVFSVGTPLTEAHAAQESILTCALGNEVTGELNANGTLTISGSGDTYDYTAQKHSPLYDVRDKINEVVFKWNNEITSIGDYLFYGCKNLSGTLDLPESLVKLGAFAFSGETLEASPKFTYVNNWYENEFSVGTTPFYAGQVGVFAHVSENKDFSKAAKAAGYAELKAIEKAEFTGVNKTVTNDVPMTDKGVFVPEFDETSLKAPSGYLFDSWLGADGKTYQPCDFTKQTSFTAVFKPDVKRLESRTVRTTAQNADGRDVSVEVTGKLPDGIKVTAEQVNLHTARELAADVCENSEIVFALDIKLVAEDGSIYNPEDYGENVSVSVKDIDVDTQKNINVLHVDNEENAQPVCVSDASGSSVSFTAESFSIYIGTVGTGAGLSLNAGVGYTFYDETGDTELTGTQILSEDEDFRLTVTPEADYNIWNVYAIGESSGITTALTRTTYTSTAVIAAGTHYIKVGGYYFEFTTTAEASVGTLILTMNDINSATVSGGGLTNASVNVYDAVPAGTDRSYYFKGSGTYNLYDANENYKISVETAVNAPGGIITESMSAAQVTALFDATAASSVTDNVHVTKENGEFVVTLTNNLLLKNGAGTFKSNYQYTDSGISIEENSSVTILSTGDYTIMRDISVCKGVMFGVMKNADISFGDGSVSNDNITYFFTDGTSQTLPVGTAPDLTKEVYYTKVNAIPIASSFGKITIDGGTGSDTPGIGPSDINGSIIEISPGATGAMWEGVTLQNNFKTNSPNDYNGGGAVRIYSSSPLYPSNFYMYGGSIRHNTSTCDGGGIYIQSSSSANRENAKLYMYAGSIEENFSRGLSDTEAALKVRMATLWLIGGQIVRNQTRTIATTYGYAIDMTGGDAYCFDCTINDNCATGRMSWVDNPTTGAFRDVNIQNYHGSNTIAMFGGTIGICMYTRYSSFTNINSIYLCGGTIKQLQYSGVNYQLYTRTQQTHYKVELPDSVSPAQDVNVKITATDNANGYTGALTQTVGTGSTSSSFILLNCDKTYTITAESSAITKTYTGTPPASGSELNAQTTATAVSRSVSVPALADKTGSSVTLNEAGTGSPEADGIIYYGYAAGKNSADVTSWYFVDSADGVLKKYSLSSVAAGSSVSGLYARSSAAVGGFTACGADETAQAGTAYYELSVVNTVTDASYNAQERTVTFCNINGPRYYYIMAAATDGSAEGHNAFPESVSKGLLVILSTVTSIDITPGSMEIPVGGTATFIARVNGTGDPSQEVKWSISGNTTPTTFVNEYGNLHVTSTGTANVVYIKATSVIDPSVSSDTITVYLAGTDSLDARVNKATIYESGNETETLINFVANSDASLGYNYSADVTLTNVIDGDDIILNIVTAQVASVWSMDVDDDEGNDATVNGARFEACSASNHALVTVVAPNGYSRLIYKINIYYEQMENEWVTPPFCNNMQQTGDVTPVLSAEAAYGTVESVYYRSVGSTVVPIADQAEFDGGTYYVISGDVFTVASEYDAAETYYSLTDNNAGTQWLQLTGCNASDFVAPAGSYQLYKVISTVAATDYYTALSDSTTFYVTAVGAAVSKTPNNFRNVTASELVYGQPLSESTVSAQAYYMQSVVALTSATDGVTYTELAAIASTVYTAAGYLAAGDYSVDVSGTVHYFNLPVPIASGDTITFDTAENAASVSAFVPGSFNWVVGDEIVKVSDSNKTEYLVSFTPSSTDMLDGTTSYADCYLPVSCVTSKVTVSMAVPETTVLPTVKYTGGDSSLPVSTIALNTENAVTKYTLDGLKVTASASAPGGASELSFASLVYTAQSALQPGAYCAHIGNTYYGFTTTLPLKAADTLTLVESGGVYTLTQVNTIDGKYYWLDSSMLISNALGSTIGVSFVPNDSVDYAVSLSEIPLKVAITVTASDQTVVYGESITQDAGQAAVSGMQAGHTLTDITLTQTTSTAGTYLEGIVPGNAVIRDSENNDITARFYDITYVNGLLAIRQATPLLDITDFSGNTTVGQEATMTVVYTNNATHEPTTLSVQSSDSTIALAAFYYSCVAEEAIPAGSYMFRVGQVAHYFTSTAAIAAGEELRWYGADLIAGEASYATTEVIIADATELTLTAVKTVTSDGSNVSALVSGMGTGSVNIYVSAAATDNYSYSSISNTVNVNAAYINYIAYPFSGVYDGNAHGVTLEIVSPVSHSETYYAEYESTGEQPADWGTATYYTASGNTVTAVAAGTVWDDNTQYYVESTSTPYTHAGEYTLYYTIHDTNGLIADTTAFSTVSISKAYGAASLSAPSWVYGSTPGSPAPVSATNGIDNVTYSYVGTGDTRYEASATAPFGGGTYKVNATFAATRDYEEVTASASFAITRADVSLALSEASATYTGSTITYTAAGGAATVTGVSGYAAPTGAVSYIYYTEPTCTIETSISDSSGALINGGAPKNVGEYYVKVNVVNDNNYNGATSAAGERFTINPFTPSVKLANKTVSYSNSVKTIDAAVVTLAGGEVFSGTVGYTYYTDSAYSVQTSASNGAATAGGAPKNAGTYYVQATVAAAGNYSAANGTAILTINPLTPTLTTSTSSVSLYADNSTTATYTYNGDGVVTITSDTPAVASVSKIGTTITINGKTVGFATITVSAAAGNGYSAAESKLIYVTVLATGSIEYTATGYNGVYDGASHTVNVSVTNPSSGCTVYYAATQLTSADYETEGSTTKPVFSAVSSNTVYFYIPSPGPAFPDAVSGSSTVVITKATHQLSVAVADKTYNGQPVVPAINADGAAYALSYSGTTADGASYSSTEAPVNAGSYTVTLSIEGDENYNASSVSDDFTIRRATPAVALASASMTYIPNTDLTYMLSDAPQVTLTGVNSEQDILDGETAAQHITGNVSYQYSTDGGYTYTNTAPTNVGTYYVKATVESRGNYKTAVSSAATFAVTKAIPSLTVSTESLMEYAGAQKTFSYTYTGDGNVSVTSANTNVALVIDNSGTVSVVGVSKGSTTVTVSVSGEKNYEAVASKTVAIEVRQRGNISYTAMDYNGYYNGTDVGIAIAITNPTSNCEVYYSDTTELTSSNYSTDGSLTPITRRYVSTTTVYYYIHYTAVDLAYSDVSGSRTITIANVPHASNERSLSLLTGSTQTQTSFEADAEFSAQFEGIAFSESNYPYVTYSKALPQGTKLTLADLSGSVPQYYYYVAGAEVAANTHIGFDEFTDMGSTSQAYDETAAAPGKYLISADFSQVDVASLWSAGSTCEVSLNDSAGTVTATVKSNPSASVSIANVSGAAVDSATQLKAEITVTANDADAARRKLLTVTLTDSNGEPFALPLGSKVQLSPNNSLWYDADAINGSFMSFTLSQTNNISLATKYYLKINGLTAGTYSMKAKVCVLDGESSLGYPNGCAYASASQNGIAVDAAGEYAVKVTSPSASARLATASNVSFKLSYELSSTTNVTLSYCTIQKSGGANYGTPENIENWTALQSSFAATNGSLTKTVSFSGKTGTCRVWFRIGIPGNYTYVPYNIIIG